MPEPTEHETETEFVDVYDKHTGRLAAVPRGWMDDPILSAPFRKTPLSEKQQREADDLIAKANPDTTTPVAGETE